MKRKEAIIQSAKNKYPYIKGLPQSVSNQVVFIEGAEWADRTMIEKSYQWILNNMHKYIKTKGFEIYVNNEDMANDFRKAMEE